jgi:hypothetical protein
VAIHDLPLPLLLCGPILRRLDSNQVSVWVALKEARTVRLRVYNGIVAVDQPEATTAATITATPYAEGTASTIRVFNNLHVALCTASTAASTSPFLPATQYSYMVSFEGGAQTEDLRSQGLLRDYDGEQGTKAVESLGYSPGTLPSFMTPPASIDKTHHLVIVHCSCSKPHGFGAPASDHGDSPDDRPDVAMLPALDDLIKDVLADPYGRPHQLFLTGDQIYADEVAGALLPFIDRLGQQLLGAGTKEVVAVAANTDTPLNQAELPAARRQKLVSDIGFTTTYGSSHLLGLTEFAAMYLLVWSPTCWWRPPKDAGSAVEKLPRIPVVARPWDTSDADSRAIADDWKQIGTKTTDGKDPAPPSKTPAGSTVIEPTDAGILPDDVEVTLQGSLSPTSSVESRLSPIYAQPGADQASKDLAAAAAKALREIRHNFVPDKRRAEGFAEKVWKVRRALANVPTYMILDDHEVTDDWYLTAGWKDKVLGSTLGRTIVRNAVAAYTIFQGWGNDPPAFAQNAPNPAGYQVLTAIQALFPTGSSVGPNASAKAQLDPLLGTDGAEPKIRFSYRVEGPVHRVIVLDTRTRRGYDQLYVSPALLSLQALDDALPDRSHLDAGLSLLFIVSAAQVIGPGFFDLTVIPALISGFDFAYTGIAGKPDPVTGINYTQPFGLYQWDVEGWYANEPSLERFLARVAQFGKVVILAGDVHYSSSYAVDYFNSAGVSARIINFTSSPAQNAWPYVATTVFKSLSWSTLLNRVDQPASRLGWQNSSPPLFDPTGEPGTLRSRLWRSPALLPLQGWSTAHQLGRQPEWWWRMTQLYDNRLDSDRPAFAQPSPAITADLPATVPGQAPVNLVQPPAGTLGYPQLASVHANSVDRSWFGRGLVWQNNYGVVIVSNDDSGQLQVSHEIHYRRPYPVPGEDPAGFTVHTAILTPTPMDRPTAVGP